MTRIADTPQRGRRGGLLGTTGGRVLGAAALLLVAVVAATQLAGPANGPTDTTESPSASPAASPTETQTPASTDVATSSPSPASGELPTGPGQSAMSFTPSCDVTPAVQVPATTVLEDGRVIWRTQDGSHLIRQLTEASLEEFREQVRATGLFETSATYDLERRPGAEPPGHGVCIWRFTWTDGDAPEVEVRSVGWLGDAEEAMYYQPSPERQRLHALAEQLMRPEAWYDDEGWVQSEPVPYQPQQYLVLALVSAPRAATLGAPDVDEVTWPFDEAPDAFGIETAGGIPTSRCAVADTAAIEELGGELAAAGLEQFATTPASGVGAALPWAARNAAVDLSIWIVLPDGRPTCESVGQ